jgi:DNA-binding MarR family transcriptional regulator
VAENGLQSWMRTLLAYVRSGDPDLTNRQMALLLLVYLKPGPHTVRGLAKALNVSKPVVTRALNRLGALGYLRRQRDDADRRNIFVAPTREGADFLEHFKALIGGGVNGQGGEKRSQRSESREPVHA